MAAVVNRKRRAAACLVFILLCDEDDGRTKRGKTRDWIKRRTGQRGFFTNIVQELRVEDTNGYKEMMRMAHEQFLEILTPVEPSVTKRQVIVAH